MRRLAFSIAALVLTGAPVAQADTPYSEAAKHFAAGREHVKHHRCDLAIPEFEASLATEASVGAYLNLADCNAAKGASGEAWRGYKLAEQLAMAKRDERSRAAHDAAAALEPKLLRLVVVAESKEGSAIGLTAESMKIDEATPPDAAVATGAMVDPGKSHVVKIALEGYEPALVTATGEAGETRMLRVALTPGPGGAAAKVNGRTAVDQVPPALGDAGKTQRTVAYVLAGTGTVALVAGAVFGFMALGQRSDLANAVAQNPSCRGEYPNGSCSYSARATLDPLESKAYTSATVSTLLVAAGAALTAAGAVVYFTAPRGGPRVQVGVAGGGGYVGVAQAF